MALSPQDLADYQKALGIEPDSNSSGLDNTGDSNSSGLDSAGTAIRQAASNFLPDLGNTFVHLAQSLKNPGNLLKQIGNQTLGAFSPRAAGGDLQQPTNPNGSGFIGPIEPQEMQAKPVVQSPQIQAFDQAANQFGGGVFAGKGLKGLQQKFENDPTGLMLDASFGLDGLSEAAGLTSDISRGLGAADVADTIGTASDKLSGAASTINPINLPFKATGAVLSKLGAPAASLNTGVVDAANDLNVNAPVEALSNSPILRSAANFLKSGFFGKSLRTATDTATSNLDSILANVTNDIPKQFDKTDYGTTLQNSLDKMETDFQKTKNKLYTDFENKYGNAPATIDKTTSAIQDLMKQNDLSAVPDTQNAFLQKLLDNLQDGKEGGSNPQVDFLRANHYTPDLLQKLGLSSQYNPTFSVLKSTRTAIGQMLKNNPELKPIYDALDADRTASLEKIDSGAAGRIKQIDEYFKTTKAQLGSKIAQSVESSTPETLVNSLIKGGNASVLSKLKSIVPPDTFQKLGTAWMSDTLKKATDESGKIDPGKFLKEYNDLDEPTKQLLFSPDQMKQLSSITSTLQKVQTIQDALSTSSGKTSQTMQLMRMASAPGALLYSIISGNTTLLRYALIIPMLTQLGEAGLSKFMSTKLGKSILTTGNESLSKTGSAINKAGNVAGRTAEIVNQSKQ